MIRDRVRQSNKGMMASILYLYQFLVHEDTLRVRLRRIDEECGSGVAGFGKHGSSNNQQEEEQGQSDTARRPSTYVYAKVVTFIVARTVVVAWTDTMQTKWRYVPSSMINKMRIVPP